MKFKIRICGKDSVYEGVLAAATDQRQKDLGRKYGPEFDGDDDPGFKKLCDKLTKFVAKFVEDGEGGDDAVTVEFDTDAGTCEIVKPKRTKK